MTAEKKLWLIEGIPGSGKSTAARKLGQTLHAQAYNEAELHPCDLAWHAVLSRAELDAFIARHPDKGRDMRKQRGLRRADAPRLRAAGAGRRGVCAHGGTRGL